MNDGHTKFRTSRVILGEDIKVRKLGVNEEVSASVVTSIS